MSVCIHIHLYLFICTYVFTHKYIYSVVFTKVKSLVQNVKFDQMQLLMKSPMTVLSKSSENLLFWQQRCENAWMFA